MCLQITVHVVFMHIIKSELGKSRLEEGLLYFNMLQSTEVLDIVKYGVM